MKKNLIKKVFAVSLSIAMACSFLPTANPVTASAAAPFVSLKTTFKTLKVGQKYKMTLKNNTINWKIRKVETTNKPIATVYGKTSSSVMIKGKGEGRATIRVKLRTTERKRNNTKTLRCRVKVVPAEQQVVTPVQTDATVTTQAELDAALANNSITKITVKPAGAVDFTIKEGTYSNVDLIVDAPQSDIDNSATFKSIQIDNIKDQTWRERGKNNKFTIRAPKASFVAESTAVVDSIALPTANADVKITVNNGTIARVTVSAKLNLNIAGAQAAGAALMSLVIDPTATDASITTDVAADVVTSANVTLVFEKNALGSKVKLAVAKITASIQNKTAQSIVVTRDDGQTRTVGANSTSKVSASAGTTTNPGGSTTYPSGGGSSSGSQTYLPAAKGEVNQNAFTVSCSALTLETTESNPVSRGALVVTVAKKTGVDAIVSGGSLAYKYRIEVFDGETKAVLAQTPWNIFNETNGVTWPFNVNGMEPGKEVIVRVSFRVAAHTGSDNVKYDDGAIITMTNPGQDKVELLPVNWVKK